VGSSTLSISGISDGTNTYTRAARVGTTSAWFELWYKLGATAVGSSATIAATCATVCTGARASIIGIQVSSVTAIDVSTGASTCTALTTAALAQVNDLALGLVGGAAAGSGSYSPPAQYSNLAYSGSGSNPGLAVDTLSNINLINKNGQAYSPSTTVFGGTTGCILATFKGN
jgi:hypothetical protein